MQQACEPSKHIRNNQASTLQPHTHAQTHTHTHGDTPGHKRLQAAKPQDPNAHVCEEHPTGQSRSLLFDVAKAPLSLRGFDRDTTQALQTIYLRLFCMYGVGLWVAAKGCGHSTIQIVQPPTAEQPAVCTGFELGASRSQLCIGRLPGRSRSLGLGRAVTSQG